MMNRDYLTVVMLFRVIMVFFIAYVVVGIQDRIEKKEYMVKIEKRRGKYYNSMN